ncbi:exodeoxyribonuclease VII large subunit, partial [Cereibacter changlensis]
RNTLNALTARLEAAPAERLRRLSDRLEALDRIRQTLGYTETLRRGYAVVRGDGAVVTTKAEAEQASGLEIEFRDGRLALGPRKPKRAKPADPPPEQGSLL